MAQKNSNIREHLSDSWKELSPGGRAAVGALGAIDALGKSLALASLARTPKEKVRGPKLVWTPVIAGVNTFGWIAWFAVGKKH